MALPDFVLEFFRLAVALDFFAFPAVFASLVLDKALPLLIALPAFLVAAAFFSLLLVPFDFFTSCRCCCRRSGKADEDSRLATPPVDSDACWRDLDTVAAIDDGGEASKDPSGFVIC